jgi:Na+/H+-dicarboxylate symporter/ABC-type amino acid transport substrate-binding protein
MSFGMKIIMGVCAGIAVGIFFGEMTAPLDVVGDIYVGLLQMTVLPYVTVSLISKIGSITLRQAKTLAGRAAVVLLLLWGIALVAVLILPISLPQWEAGSFFSSTLVERPQEFDFLGLYLPTNPFHSLANNIVPAVVLFSILIGGALIGVPGKSRLLEPLEVVGDALGRVSDAIVRIAPYGTFALSAGAAGRLSPQELFRVSGYVSTYTIGVVLLTFLVLPGFVAAITPFRYRELLFGSREAILTAFATGKLFPVLPMVIRNTQGLLAGRGVPEEEAEATADLFVPLGYPFPNAGKVLALLFVPFAAWFIGRPLEPEQYPMLLSVGLFAFFGSPVAAIPFLLDLFRLPSDLFPLFLIAGLWCARIGDVLGAMHLLVFSVVCSAWKQGWLRVALLRIAAWTAIVAAGFGLAVLANRVIVSRTLLGQDKTSEIVANLGLPGEFAQIEVLQESTPNPEPLQEGESRVERVRRTRTLRVGVVTEEPPFVFINGAGRVVGFDVDLIQRMAGEARADLVLVPVRRTEIPDGLRSDRFDFAVGGIPSTIRNFGLYDESDAYLELHAALLVPDRRAEDFASVERVRELADLEGVRIGYERLGLHVQRADPLPGLKLEEIESAEAFIEGRTGVDALLTTAESGAIYTMLRPDFSVVIPERLRIDVPVVFAVAEDRDLKKFLDTWIRLRRGDGTIDRLYDYWILGKGTAKRATHRWSVIRDVLGWVD